MGVYVDLDVAWEAVEPVVWHEIYDETLRLLRAHPSQLMGFAWRPLLGREVPMYTEDIEVIEPGDRVWSVAGDRRSMRFAEVLRMSRADSWKLRYPEKLHKDGVKPRDIVWQDPDRGRGARLFGGKTRGLPYHVPIVAAGLVIEGRLPGAALLSGDINEATAREAKGWAEEVLGREVPMPVLLDAPALVRRLSPRWSGEALIEAFAQRFRGEVGPGLARAFDSVERPAAERYLRARLSMDDPGGRGPEHAEVVRGWLLSTGDVARLWELSAGLVWAEDMASLLAGIGVLLPPALRTRAAQCRAMELPPRPDVSSLGGMLGLVFLNRDWSGPAVDEDALDAALRLVYPGKAAALGALLREESRKLEELVASMCESVERSVEFRAGLDPYQDIGELVALRSAEELVPFSRGRLAAFGYLLRCAKESGSNGAADEPRDPEAMRSQLVDLASGGMATLTEHAWGWIVAETDVAVLELLSDLLQLGSILDETSLRRAALESRVVCCELLRMMGDAASMAEGKAFVEGELRKLEEMRARSMAEPGPGPGRPPGGDTN